MEFLLIAGLLGGLAGFLSILFYYNVPPQTLAYNFIGRFCKPPERLRAKGSEAPYRRIRRGSGQLHRPILLNLETSDGSGQAVHPDVAYVPGGFGPSKWTYWMVCTPYPDGNERLENPEVFVSFDGMNWTIPDGLRNPIVPPPEIAGDHHSDPDIFFHENMLWIVYRQTIRSRAPRKNLLYLINSTDGISWSEPVEILHDSGGAELLSPSVIHDGSCFILWTIESHGGEFQIMRRTSEDCRAWGKPEKASTSTFGMGRHVWHIDVTPDKGRLSALLVSSTKINGGESRIHYAHSLDRGLHWEVSDFLFQQLYEFESLLQYRGTLRSVEDSEGRYQLWYSAISKNSVSSIAYLPVIRTRDNLFPVDPALISVEPQFDNQFS